MGGCSPFGDGLFGFVGFEKLASLCQVEGVSVHDELIFARVIRDFEYAFYLMAALAEGLDEKIDIYHHASQSTGSFSN
jgi:hypothetical protein